MSTKLLATSLVSLCACIVPNPFSRGDDETGADTSETRGDAESGTASMGDGDPSGDGEPTGDGDPSGDGDGEPTGDGDPSGDGDGDPSGDGDGDPMQPNCTRRLWTFDFNEQKWMSSPLDNEWVGANAPPCAVEVWATTYVETSDQLLAFMANGRYYRRHAGVWDQPEAIAARYPQLDGLTLESMIYVPPIEGYEAQLLINSLPSAYLYFIEPNGDVTYDQAIPIMDEPNGGPPQSSSVRRWAISMGNPELLGDATWWTTWQGFDDGHIYFADGAFNWSSWLADDSPLYTGVGSKPDFDEIEAGWGDYRDNLGFVVAR